MQSRFIENCGNLFRLAQNHLINPSKAMSKETLEENFGGEDVNRRYIIPMATVLAVTSIVASLLWSDERNLAAIVYSAIVSAVSPVLIYYMIRTSSLLMFKWFRIKEDAKGKAQKMTMQLMLLYFVVEFLSTILPGAGLLLCLYIYAFYMIWFMAGELLGLAEQQRIKFMLSEMTVCAITYIIIMVLLYVITPKHPKL